MNIQISVITVVYNGFDSIEGTIQSVINQSYDSFEYIIIDGASTDATLSIIDNYKGNIDCLKSERDNGIYDAMNKAIKVARGNYCVFMNSGDFFYDNNTLSKVSEFFKAGYDIIYGQARFFSPDEGIEFDFGRKVVESNFYSEMPICHQSIFFRTELFSEIGEYDTSLKIKADHEWMLRYYHLRTANTYYTQSVIARYNMIGYAVSNKLKSIAEFKSIATKYLPRKNRLKMKMKYPFLVLKYTLYKQIQNSWGLKMYRKMKYS